jgi:hypothetical protein
LDVRSLTLFFVLFVGTFLRFRQHYKLSKKLHIEI